MTTIPKSSIMKVRQHRKNKRPCTSATIALSLLFALFLYLVLYMNKNEDTVRHTPMLRKNASGGSYDRCHVLFKATPDEISKMEELDLKDCNLTTIPTSIQYAVNIKKLDVSGNPLSTFPNELKSCRKLDILFASKCAYILSLPPVLGDMPSITRLGWRSGSLTSIDPNGLPPNLVHLILTDNKIESMDDVEIFEKLKNVRKLMLSHNGLRNFGGNGGVERLKSLELLRLGGNKLESIPDQLWTLPSLTWLTISGNPVTDAFKSTYGKPDLISLKMNDLERVGSVLGEGASGKVSLFKWQGKEVAVKLIHGVTSDGKAEDELSIYSAVGSNGLPNRVVGCLALLDDERKGVIMEPLPSNLEDFALPPTIVEVTADRWDRNNTPLTASFVKNSLQDALTALSFLHNHGISHGDFYAHNIKANPVTGRLYLLDFGASYFKGTFAKEAEKLEVRAYGVLVGELLLLLDPAESQLKSKLAALRDHCMNVQVSKRPTFSSLQSMINTL